MNIIVKPFEGDCCYCRPDTSWEKENRDFYCPENISRLDWAPIVFLRISKAGKCVAERFASRYYDAFNFGALIYIGDFMPCIASASCVDHTSLLPFPLYNPIVIEGEENIYEVRKNGELIFTANAGVKLREMAEKALCKASELISLRIGDLLAIELAPVSPLAIRSENEINMKASFCENTLYEPKLKF